MGKLTVTATAPESANYLSIVLVTGKGARGTSYWDNLVIDGKAQETPEDPEDPEDPTDPTDPEDPAEDAFEQLQNPGFEEPLNEGQIPHWTLIMGSNQPVLDDTAKYEGNYSIKIEDDSNSDVVGVISDYVKITKGMQVTAKAMVAGNSTGNAELYLRFFDENNQMISQANTVIAAPSEEWQEATVSAIAPENAVKAAVLLYSSKANREYTTLIKLN